MENENNIKLFETSDFTLSATLIYLKFEMKNMNYQVEGSNPRPVAYFQFEDTPELEDAINKFWNKKLAVEPRDYGDNIRGLKAQIKSYYKGPSSGYNRNRN